MSLQNVHTDIDRKTFRNTQSKAVTGHMSHNMVGYSVASEKYVTEKELMTFALRREQVNC